jgi:hypothetical protein
LIKFYCQLWLNSNFEVDNFLRIPIYFDSNSKFVRAYHRPLSKENNLPWVFLILFWYNKQVFTDICEIKSLKIISQILWGLLLCRLFPNCLSFVVSMIHSRREWNIKRICIWNRISEFFEYRFLPGVSNTSTLMWPANYIWSFLNRYFDY